MDQTEKQREDRRTQVAELIAGGLTLAAVGKRLGVTRGVVGGDVVYLRKVGLLPPSRRRSSNLTVQPVPPPSHAPVAGMQMGKLERMTVSIATCPKCGARFVAESNGR